MIGAIAGNIIDSANERDGAYQLCTIRMKNLTLISDI